MEKIPSYEVFAEGIGGTEDHDNTVVVGDTDTLRIQVIDARTGRPKAKVPVFVKIAEGGRNACFIDRGNLDDIKSIDIMDPGSSAEIDEALICLNLSRQTNDNGRVDFILKYVAEGTAKIVVSWPDSGLGEPGIKEINLQIFNLEKDALFCDGPIDTSDLIPKAKPVSCHVDSPDTILIGTPNTITVKAQAGFQPATGISVEVEVLSDNAEVARQEDVSAAADNPRVSWDDTDADGLALFRLNYLPGKSGDVRYIVRWNDFMASRGESGERVARLIPRALTCELQAESRRKLGEDLVIAVRIYERITSGVPRVPVRIITDEPGVKFYLTAPAESPSRETSVESDRGNTDESGQIFFRMKYSGEEAAVFQYAIEWLHDNTWRREDRRIAFEKDNTGAKTHADTGKEKDMTAAANSPGVSWKEKIRKFIPSNRVLYPVTGAVAVVVVLLVVAAALSLYGIHPVAWYERNFNRSAPKITPGHASGLSAADTDMVIEPAAIAAEADDVEFSASAVPPVDPEEAPLFAALASDNESSSLPDEAALSDDEAAEAPPPAAADDSENRILLVDARIVSKELNVKLDDAVKAKKLAKEVETLESDLTKAEKKAKNLKSTNQGLEDELAELKAKVAKLNKFAKVMENILDHIKVGPVECTGRAEVVWEDGRAKEVNMTDCEVMISVDF